MNNYEDDYAGGAASDGSRRLVQTYIKLLGYGLVLLWWAFYYGLLYSPLLFLGYLTMHALPALHHGNLYAQAGLISCTAYLAYSSLFFLKGLLISLREQGQAGWIVLLLPCLVLACGLPVIIMHLLLAKWFTSLTDFWTWLGGVAFAGVVYQRYQFTTPGAPALGLWAYRWGLGLLRQPMPIPSNHAP